MFQLVDRTTDPDAPSSANKGWLYLKNGQTYVRLTSGVIVPVSSLSDDQIDALAGTDGMPSAANPFVTDSDPRLAGSSGITDLTGDVTASGPGSAAATIANDAVTYAKMQNVSATDKILGRSSAGAGDVQEIACTAAGRALLDDATAGDQRTTLGLGTAATQPSTAFDAAGDAATAGAAAASAAAAALAAHEGDTTGIHGISDTSALVLNTRSVAAGTGLSGGGNLSADRTIDLSATNVTKLAQIDASGNTTGNAATATKLATARNINGVPFDGTADITVAGPSAKRTITLTEDFVTTNAIHGGLYFRTHGAGADNFQIRPDAVANARNGTNPGWCGLNTGTDTDGDSWIYSGQGGSATRLSLGYGSYVDTFVVQIPTLSDGTDRFNVFAGHVHDVASVDFGVYFQYRDDLNGGKWLCVCKSSGGTSTADSGVTVVEDTIYTLEIEINAAGTSAVFKINGSTVATVSTNLPIVDTDLDMAFGTGVQKTAGSTARQLNVDLLDMTLTLTASR